MADLLQEKLRQILYIACDPATWARDVGWLAQGGTAYAMRVLMTFTPSPTTSSY